MLNSKQKIALRKIAHTSNLVKFNIGKDNIDKNVLATIENGLVAYELIKVAFLKSALEGKSFEELVLDISGGVHADVVQEIGHTVILYRPNPKLKNPLKF